MDLARNQYEVRVPGDTVGGTLVASGISRGGDSFQFLTVKIFVRGDYEEYLGFGGDANQSLVNLRNQPLKVDLPATRQPYSILLTFDRSPTGSTGPFLPAAKAELLLTTDAEWSVRSFDEQGKESGCLVNIKVEEIKA